MKASPDPTSPNWRHDFLSFCVDCDVLRFGEFTLKSGRSSPYFFNAGLFNTGGRLATLGKYYAVRSSTWRRVRRAARSGVQGHPARRGDDRLAGAESRYRRTASASIARRPRTTARAGTIVGSPLKGKTLVIDDVITAGTAIRESASLVAAQGATLAGVVVALDREERGADTELTAIGQVRGAGRARRANRDAEAAHRVPRGERQNRRGVAAARAQEGVWAKGGGGGLSECRGERESGFLFA